jgi:hypothetical protein
MASPRVVRIPPSHDTSALKQLVAEKKLEGDRILEKVGPFLSVPS